MFRSHALERLCARLGNLEASVWTFQLFTCHFTQFQVLLHRCVGVHRNLKYSKATFVRAYQQNPAKLNLKIRKDTGSMLLLPQIFIRWPWTFPPSLGIQNRQKWRMPLCCQCGLVVTRAELKCSKEPPTAKSGWHSHASVYQWDTLVDETLRSISPTF